MASQHRMTVNLSTQELRNQVTLLAQKNGISESKLIEIALRATFFEDQKQHLQVAALLHGVNANSRPPSPQSELQAALSFSRVSVKNGLLSSHYSLDSFSFGVFHLPDDRLDLRQDFSLYSSGLIPLSWSVIKEVVLEKMNAYLPKMVDIFDVPPDALHIFLYRIEVTYYTDENRMVRVDVKPQAKLMPVYLTNNKHPVFEYFDFEGISYQSFKKLALEPPNQRKYAQFLYIDSAVLSTTGGYFIGICHDKQRWNHAQNDSFIPYECQSEPSKTVYCKFYIQDNLVKVKRRQPPKREQLQFKKP